MAQKQALITGITGQDGAYLAQFLFKKGYKVFGFLRSAGEKENLRYLGIDHEIEYIEGDILDEKSIRNAILESKPDELYHLAAQSFVGISWEEAKLTTQINAFGTLNILSELKTHSPHTKFYQASTSEMFGNSHENGLQREETPFHPLSPYAISKLYAYWITNNFKESYKMFCCNGIMFNHESPIRGLNFVTRKISNGVAKIKLNKAQHIRLGNLDSMRDWGFAGDYVKAMWLMLQQEKPDNYIISTGETHSIRDFLDVAFNHVGIQNWEPYVVIDESFKRPSELMVLKGQNSKAKEVLNWEPTVSFEELVKMMVDADLEREKIATQEKSSLKNNSPLTKSHA